MIKDINTYENMNKNGKKRIETILAKNNNNNIN